MAKKLIIILWLAVLFVFRAHDYGRYPLAGHADELNYGWAGISLWRTGVPLGWSGHAVYPKSWIVFDGMIGKGGPVAIGVKMFKPWLDEPPLFSLMAGGAAYLYNDETMNILPASHIRIPSILFGFATTILLFFWASKWYGKKVGLLVATIYTLTPIFLFGSRLALPENGITFLFVLGLYLFTFYDTTRHKWWIVSALPILAGMAGLMKPTGFFLALLFTFLLAKKRQWKQAIVVFVGVLPFIAAFFGYYFWQGGEAASEILRVQGFRPSGWSSLGYIFSTPFYSTSNEPLYDGWYVYLLLASAAYVFTKQKDEKIGYLTTAFIFWLGVVVASSGEQDPLAWYRYPMFPLVAFLGTLTIVDTIKRPTLVTGFMAVGMWLASRFFVHNAFMATTDSYTFKLMLGLLMAPFVWHELRPGNLANKARKGVLVGLLVVGLYLNARFAYSAFPIICEAISCPIQPGTWMSELRIPFFWRYLTPKQYIGVWN